MRVVVSEFMDEGALGAFAPPFAVEYAPGLVDDRPALLSAVAAAEGLIVRNRTSVDAALLAAAPRLKVVGRLGVGLDNIDLQACAARGVAVRPATGANMVSVAEYVIAATLILLRRAYGSSADVAGGLWPRGALIGGEASGKRLGLWGYGAIARAVAVRAQALGMEIVALDPFLPADDPAWQGVERAADAAALLQGSDVLSLHLPLTAETRGVLGAEQLAEMTPGAILINTARGGLVDEAAVAAALSSGALGGAALDVFGEEPLSAATGAGFVGVPNLILTPHVAGVTREANARVSALTVENVIAELSNG